MELFGLLGCRVFAMKLSDGYILGAVALAIGALLLGMRPEAGAVQVRVARPPTSAPSLFESGSLGVPEDASP